ncbi:MAG: DUF3846 domain-containing protein [Lachnospiraceae bacterium]|nr:DUF3846 domain-containing protein [Lachnospiraceae bacterium]
MRVEQGSVYKGYIGEIEDSLAAKQKYVGGQIQVLPLNDDICIIYNDEGKLEHLPLNRAFVEDSKVLDVFVGNIMAVRRSSDGDFTSIREEDIPIIEKIFLPVRTIAHGKVILRSADALEEYRQS